MFTSLPLIVFNSLNGFQWVDHSPSRISSPVYKTDIHPRSLRSFDGNKTENVNDFDSFALFIGIKETRVCKDLICFYERHYDCKYSVRTLL